MNNGDIKTAPKHSMKNRDALELSDACACYHCLAVYKPADIREWTDRGRTAICPHCNVDAVLGDRSRIPLDGPSLEKLRKYWFGDHHRPKPP